MSSCKEGGPEECLTSLLRGWCSSIRIALPCPVNNGPERFGQHRSGPERQKGRQHLSCSTQNGARGRQLWELYTVTLISGDRRSGTRAAITNASGSGPFVKPLDNAGNKTITNYPAYASQFIYNVTIPGCAQPGKVFAGQRQEAFAVNLGPIFDLVNLVPIEGSIAQSMDNQELIGKKNVTSLAIEVPTACLTGGGNGVIGVWSTASLPQAKLAKPNPTYKAPALYGGAYTQVSRLGMPLVNELVIGLPDKDTFNAAKPSGDAALADYVTNPTFPAILQVLFGSAGIKAPTNFPRNDLVATFSDRV